MERYCDLTDLSCMMLGEGKVCVAPDMDNLTCVHNVRSKIEEAAQALFDNRLGWSDGRNSYAPRTFWAELSEALYGKDNPKTQELRGPQGRLQ
ncbi:MAG: hypothetical protein V3S49_04900 [Thermodesulfobacteriota bacterium]